MVSTVRPNARETPSRPIPTAGNVAARTAAPHPANVSQKVPKNSAVTRRDILSRIIPPTHGITTGRDKNNSVPEQIHRSETTKHWRAIDAAGPTPYPTGRAL